MKKYSKKIYYKYITNILQKRQLYYSLSKCIDFYRKKIKINISVDMKEEVMASCLGLYIENNLIKYASENNIDADFFIGIESGITNKLGKWCIIQIAVIKDKNGYESFGAGPAFPVPDKYVDEIINTELAIVMDKIFNGNGLRNEKGGIAHLTKDVVTRYDLTREALIMALTEFINGDIWRD